MRVFVPEKYVNMLELVVEIPGHGKGILLSSDDLSKAIKEGRVHKYLVGNRDLVYIIEETALIQPPVV